jgi:hypothetical protein
MRIIKLRFLPVLLLGTVLLSCKTTKNDSLSVSPDSFIGTKWDWILSFAGISNTIEFIDESNCIYTLGANRKEFPYTAKKNKIFIGKKSLELRGDTIYYKGEPHFRKMYE